MKKLLSGSVAVAILTVGLVFTAYAEVKGPIVDKVYVNVKMKEEIGLKDTAEGLTDMFFYGVDGQVVQGLSQETRDKLDFYTVPSGSWSIAVNPYPNEAPYIAKAPDQEYFNPFAIRDIRFALNFLINRKYIVDEILQGAGGSMFSMATPGQPGTYKYHLQARRMGFTPEGDEKKALEDIEAAMRQAAALPAMNGRLSKEGDWWTFDGKPVTIHFLIRVDDPQGRLIEGHYIADQIEKAGIKVERLLWDRSKCSQAVYAGNPADYEWTLYTEGWGAGATRAWWEHIVAQMYAPWYGYMPGGGDPNNWNYEHEELDTVTEKAYSGNFVTEEEYWDLALKGQKLGLQEAVRVYVAYQTEYFAANKARFNRRMAYGVGDGLNHWSVITADTKEKVLRITGFSAKGSLFMNAWDPIGDDGFSDTYSGVCAEPTGTMALVENPVTAAETPMLATPQDIETQVERNADGEVVGTIAVPAEALMYDSVNNEWAQVGEGVTAMSRVTYEFDFSTFHHGRSMGFADYMYAGAFLTEWAKKDSEDDPYFDAPFSSSWLPVLLTKGWVINSDNAITTYFDYNFPASDMRVAYRGAPALSVSSGRPNIHVSWEIMEALGKMVAEGSASGTNYSFTYGAATEPDVLVPEHVADIRAKLVEMKEAGHVPDGIKGYVSPEEAVAGYEAAIEWIDAHGHAMIASGPFYIEQYDPTTNYMELHAFRDPGYPFTPDYWADALRTTMLRVESVDIPEMYAAEETIMPVRVYVSQVLYPDNTSKPAEQGTVSAMLVTDSGEFTYQADYVEPGLFEVEIPVEGLDAGSYTILINAEIEGAAPSSKSASTLIY